MAVFVISVLKVCGFLCLLGAAISFLFALNRSSDLFSANFLLFATSLYLFSIGLTLFATGLTFYFFSYILVFLREISINTKNAASSQTEMTQLFQTRLSQAARVNQAARVDQAEGE